MAKFFESPDNDFERARALTAHPRHSNMPGSFAVAVCHDPGFSGRGNLVEFGDPLAQYFVDIVQK
jgi:hypothetical protein